MKSELFEIPGYPGYAVTKDGKVFSLNYWHKGIVHELIPVLSRGYYYVNIWQNRKQIKQPIHRLIAITFLPPHPLEKSEINHKNGVKLDNIPDNLEWCTHSDNMRHAWGNKLIHIDDKWIEKCRKIGSGTGALNGKRSGYKRAILTKEQAYEIKNRLSNERITQKQIAQEFGISEQTVSNIVHDKRASYM